MQQHRDEDGEATAAAAAPLIAKVVVALGKAVKRAHEHAEARVPRHRRDRADCCRAEAVHQHIADIFPQGKAQRDKHRIHNAVELAVEFA